MHDILPKDHLYFSLLKKFIRHRAREAGFKRITTPVLEDMGLIKRAIGESTDIVQKEMFTMERNDKSYVLRPENTAAVMRSYIEHGMSSLPQPIELYYISPMFRAEKPQKGRYRQFFQYGLEIIGESDAALDAQLIHTGWMIMKDAGITDDMVVQLNSIGDKEDREQYKQALKDFFIGKERSLTEVSKKRLETNPLRILDTKDEDEQILLGLAPKIQDYISTEAKEYHELVKEYLDELGVPYVENPNLVRGLDYYNRTTFEYTKKDNPSFAFGGGGRYDGLAEELGGVPTPAIGFAAGMERIIEEMKEQHISVFDKDKIQVFVAHIGGMAKKKSISILAKVRDKGIKTMGSMGKSSILAQMKYANKFNADWALVLGETEVRNNQIIIKNMDTGSQEKVALEDCVEKLVEKIGVENILHYREE